MKRERWHAQRDGEGATCLRLPRPVNGSCNDSVKCVATLLAMTKYNDRDCHDPQAGLAMTMY